MVKSVHVPHLNKNVKFGRRHPVAVGPRLHLKEYLRAKLPAPPASIDYSPRAQGALSQMYLNDQLGDCVIAAGYHIVGCETGNAGNLFVATDAQITHDYSAIGGYNPSVPDSDQGCDMQTALNYWVQSGFQDKTKMTAWLAVDATDENEVKSAMWLFENLFVGMSLPDKWINPFPAGPGFTWDAAGAAVPENGHAIMGVGYNTSGVLVDTWGMIGTLTWRALAKYAVLTNGGELYVMLTPDQLAKGQSKAPNGVDWSDIVKDWNSMGGSIPVPSPSPSPTPLPPAPVPTRASLAKELYDLIHKDADHGAQIMTASLRAYIPQLG